MWQNSAIYLRFLLSQTLYLSASELLIFYSLFLREFLWGFGVFRDCGYFFAWVILAFEPLLFPEGLAQAMGFTDNVLGIFLLLANRQSLRQRF